MRHLMPLIAAVALVLSTVPAQADLGDQLFKLLPADGASEDYFGISVAISGTTAIVGADWDDDNDSGSGSAYLFNTTTGQQITKLLPDDGAIGQAFGRAVAIHGSTAIVGAYRDDDNGFRSGSAYLVNTTSGAQIAKLLPDDGAPENAFGFSVAISGTTVIVGAFGHEDNGELSGAAYVFDISDPTSPTQIAKLLPDDGAEGDHFGTSVGISDTTAIVGAQGDDDNGSYSGSAYVFDTLTGQQTAKLLPNDGADTDFFGRSVAISGATVIVGARYDDDNGNRSGSAYLFDTTTGQQIAKLLPDDGAELDHFGWSVAISDTTAIVGAYEDDDACPEIPNCNSGSAYLFDISDPEKPAQIAKLLPDDGAAGDEFGWSVAISGTTAIVGARFDDDNGANSGSAYFFCAGGGSTCPWNFDGNCAVGASDLAVLLGFWGPNPGHPADLDADGTIGPADLAILLKNWGPCP